MNIHVKLELWISYVNNQIIIMQYNVIEHSHLALSSIKKGVYCQLHNKQINIKNSSK